jgi:hypothetical protein
MKSACAIIAAASVAMASTTNYVGYPVSVPAPYTSNCAYNNAPPTGWKQCYSQIKYQVFMTAVDVETQMVEAIKFSAPNLGASTFECESQQVPQAQDDEFFTYDVRCYFVSSITMTFGQQDANVNEWKVRQSLTSNNFVLSVTDLVISFPSDCNLCAGNGGYPAINNACLLFSPVGSIPGTLRPCFCDTLCIDRGDCCSDAGTACFQQDSPPTCGNEFPTTCLVDETCLDGSCANTQCLQYVNDFCSSNNYIDCQALLVACKASTTSTSCPDQVGIFCGANGLAQCEYVARMVCGGAPCS